MTLYDPSEHDALSRAELVSYLADCNDLWRGVRTHTSHKEHSNAQWKDNMIACGCVSLVDFWPLIAHAQHSRHRLND